MTTFTFNFNSRETYLAQTAEWKIIFHDQIRKARADKIAFKEAQREFSKAGGDQVFDHRWDSNKKKMHSVAIGAMYDAMYKVRKNVKIVQELIAARQLARSEAGRQMEANRAVKYI